MAAKQEKKVDVHIERAGLSLFTFRLDTPAARDWVADNVADPVFWGELLVVDTRLAGDLAQGMHLAGLRVT